MILDKIAQADIYTVYILIILCAVFFLTAGIMLVIKKDTKLISKFKEFHQPELFAVVYGIIEIVISAIMIILTIIGFLFIDLYWTVIIVTLLLVITQFLIQIFLQKRYKK